MISATITEGSIAIIGRSEPLARLEGLDGASLALPFKGSLPDLMMRRIAEPGAQSWQPHYTGTLVARMQLLLAGKVDAAMLPEPMASLALVQNPLLIRRHSPRSPEPGFSLTNDTLICCPPCGAGDMARCWNLHLSSSSNSRHFSGTRELLGRAVTPWLGNAPVGPSLRQAREHALPFSLYGRPSDARSFLV